MKYFLKGLAKILLSPLVVLLIPIGGIQCLGGADYNETYWVKFMDWFTTEK